MILVEAGQRGEPAFDTKLLLAAQLARRGYQVVLDQDAVPEAMTRRQRYDAAPYLARVEDLDLSHVLVIGAEAMADETLLRLRTIAGPAPVTAIGRFADYQAQLGARARLAYALGREPDLVDLSRLSSGASFGLIPTADPGPRPPGPPRVYAFLPPEWLEQPGALAILAGIDAHPGFRLAVVTASRGKDFVNASRHSALAVFAFADLALGSLATRADVAVFFGEMPGGELAGAFAAACIGAGKPVIDGTTGGAMRASGAPVLRGPEDPASLPGFLQVAVLPNLAALGNEARSAPWTADRSLAALESALGLTPPPPPEPRDGRVLFLPTNGMGLGHAQRCALIADAMDTSAEFAAFPSCVPMLQARGYPCTPLVARSDEHVEEYANDVLNYVRLRRSLGPRDHLVFDGGYIFESIHGAIQETGCRATWIRRGLWRAAHNATAPTERETAFSRIIVPAEAFAELNDPAFSPVPVSHVGPIVRTDPGPDPAETRERLAQTLGTEFDTLVVSMLGSGASMDRSAQLQAMAGLLAARPRLLHLIVAWPTSRIPPGLMAWPNTRVVRTRDALPLARAADVVVTAAGYNSFHEVLYHRIPAIFVPQVAPILDDQERRARAATERGLAEIVMPHEIMTLDRSLAAFLDAGRGAELRTALAALDLPRPGNAEAARLIEEDLPR